MKIKNIKTSKVIKAVACSRPKMTSHRGRTWDCFTIMLNGEEKKCHLDTTWGFYGYFQHNNRWYKVQIFDVEDAKDCDLWKGNNEFEVK